MLKLEEIPIEIIKTSNKNTYIRIKNNRVYVRVSKFSSKEYINEVILKNKEWIISTYEKEVLKNEKQIQDLENISDEDLEIFQEKVKEYVEKNSKAMGLYPKKVRIRNLNCAWGSCSQNKNISINVKLMFHSDEALEYVIIHELAHLKHMNHSKDFWNLVGKYCPPYKLLKKELRS